jgi:F0F1-type ATP synthase gamma subunit
MERNEITLLAKNSAEEPFKVTFKKDEDKLFITCTCPEGMHGEFCEHKFRLASNDIMMLQHPGQNSEMLNAHMWVIDAPISDKLIQLLQLLGDEESDEDAIAKTQAEIGKAMREGTV